jgi:spermidine synthase
MVPEFTINTDDVLPFNWRAETAVFASGVTSMGLEVLAGRVIAPVFGNSVYTWGGVLGVFMIALGVGYWLGGKRAHERASEIALTKILTYSVITIGVMSAVYEQVVQVSALLPIPAIYAPIIPLTILFGPPTFLLGFISPYAAELSEARSTGEASGRVYSLGTVGSIFGAFLTTYGLIPYLSVLWIQILFAGSLVVVALAISYPPSVRSLARVGLAVVIVIFAAGFTPATATSGNTVYETETPYQHLRIADDDGVRTMYLNDHPQSAMYLDNRSGYVWDYESYAHLSHLYRQADSVDRVLVIGGAGFSIPKRFLAEYPNVTVDVVELDPEVVNAAKTHFNVSDSPRLNIYTQDGRRYLRNTNHTYDAIVLDAYQKNNVPFHLTTVEFMQLVSERLDERGIFIQNIISAAEGPRSKFMRSEFKTVQRVFPSAEIYPTGTTPRAVQNVMVTATKGPDMTQAELQHRSRQRSIGINLSQEVQQYRGPGAVATADVPVLRDGDAPVDRLTGPLYDQPYVIQQTNASRNRQPPAQIQIINAATSSPVPQKGKTAPKPTKFR